MSKLCIGSYAQMLKKYYNGTNENLSNDLANGIENDIYIDKGNVSRIFNCKGNISKDLIDSSQGEKVLKNIEKYFSDYIIPNLKVKLQNNLIQDMLKLISGDNSISIIEIENFKSIDTNNLAKFLSQIFLYALLQNNVCPNALENLGELPIKKNKEFNTTINPFGFENVFIELLQNNDLGLLNNNHIKTFHFDVENNNFSYLGLNNYLLKNVGRYIYSRMQMDNFEINDEKETIALKAIQKLKDNGFSDEKLGNELGNIIIYILLEKILKAPKLYTSIECGDKNLDNAGVHLLKLSGQENFFQMVFSESNITNSIQNSIDNAFTNLSLLNKSLSKNYNFLEASILSQNFDEETSKQLKKIIIPQKRDNAISLSNAFGLLIGYSIQTNKNVDNKTYNQNIKEQMLKDLQEELPYIIEKINNLKMTNSSFYIYLVPFDNAENDKTTIMKNIVGGSL
ncbi:MAG: DUF1837 domain-containing protein [Clostridia bacterium]